MLKLFLLFVGLLAIGLIVWHIGPGRIYDVAAQLGPVALLVMLIPSVIMYVVEAYGWKVTLGPSTKDIPFWRLVVILVKWALAAIPATIVVMLIVMLVAAVFGGIFGLGMMMQRPV